MHLKVKDGFYYLIQSYREGEVKNYEKYFGKKKPTAEQTEDFLQTYFQTRWHPQLQEILTQYKKIIKSMSNQIQSNNLRAFGIRFTHNTNKIEGSSLSNSDTRAILELDQVPSNSDVNDVVEVKAHMHVYEQMIEEQKPLSLGLILEWHRQLFQLSKPSHAGSVRYAPVFIGGSKFTPPSSRDELDLLLDELFEWYYSTYGKYSPVFIAAVFHLRFVSIHPFEDGNGRITRLITNFILHKTEWPMFDLDAKHRIAYYNALERSNLKNDESYFLSWFVTRYIKYARNTLKNLGVKQKEKEEKSKKT